MKEETQNTVEMMNNEVRRLEKIWRWNDKAEKFRRGKRFQEERKVKRSRDKEQHGLVEQQIGISQYSDILI